MILKFKLDGKTAFYKNPEVNSNIFFTFNHIHKVAVMGLVGATIGLNGYNQSGAGVVPEFYEKLKDIKVAICPNKKEFHKKIIKTTNTTGFASTEGGALITREQVLFNVSWDIYIKIDCKEIEIFKEMLLNCESVYPQYLGKNEHMAEISEVEVFSDSDIIEEDGKVTINSLAPASNKIIGATYSYKEFLPCKLNNDTLLYECSNLQYTNGKFNCKYTKIGNKRIIFI